MGKPRYRIVKRQMRGYEPYYDLERRILPGWWIVVRVALKREQVLAELQRMTAMPINDQIIGVYDANGEPV